MILEFLVISLAMLLVGFSIYALVTLFSYVKTLKKQSKKINISPEISNSFEKPHKLLSDYHKWIEAGNIKYEKDELYIHVKFPKVSFYEIDYDEKDLLTIEKNFDQFKNKSKIGSENESYKVMLDQIPPRTNHTESPRYY